MAKVEFLLKQDQSFDGRADKFARNIYDSTKGRIRTTIVWSDIEACLARLGNRPLRILDAGGGFGYFAQKLAAMGHQVELCDLSAEMLELAHKALTEHSNQLTEEYTVVFLETGETQATAALLHGGLGSADEADRKLLEVFSSKIAIALANALTYQKMITAEQAATTDFLTGLNNRRQLLRLGVPLVAGAHRSGTPLAVAMLDIDHFKRINDTWGHDAGDEVLRCVGRLLQERFRTSDVVARFGGEEFCVIAVNLGPESALELFDGFRQQLAAETFEFAGQVVSLTISIGITTQVVDNIDTMISAADALLYRAKEAGRNRAVLA